MTGILEWIAAWILKYLFDKASKAIEDHAKDVARDKERGEINAANVAKYEAALTEKGRLDNALSLLNRTRS